MKVALLIMAMILVGCSATKVTHGIPNLRVVNKNVYRGGQPTDEGIRWLESQGVTTIVKLNEAEPEPWGGYRLKECPIGNEEMVFNLPAWKVEYGVGCIRHSPGKVFVHCLHGQDRTGLIVAAYRVRVEHWSKAKAEKEMLKYGFHKDLRGLWERWESFSELPPKKEDN